MSRRLIIDFSDLYSFLTGHNRVSGIQRVLVNFAARLIDRQERKVILGYYDKAYNVYGYFPTQRNLEDIEALRNSTRFPHVRQFRPEKYRNKPIRRFYHDTRARMLRILKYRVFRRIFPSRFHPAPEPLRFQDGDVILSLGGGWDATEMYQLVEPVVREGTVTLIVLVHDMTPIIGVDGRGGLPLVIFEGWLTRAARATNRFLTYSENTKKDLIKYLGGRGIDGVSVEVFPLAHEFLLGKDGPVAEHIRVLAKAEYALFVGPLTFERKNADRLITAWFRLFEELGPQRMPRLVLAGRGSKADIKAPEADQLGDHLTLIHMPSDAELEFLYRNALFTVFPSTYEGWGLPIGESLWYGKFCVASNASSMPEVGGELCDYFDPYDIDDMTESVRRPIVDREYLERRQAAIDKSKLITWDQSAEYLLAAVQRLTQ